MYCCAILLSEKRESVVAKLDKSVLCVNISSFLIPHSSFLIPHSSFLIPHSSFLIPHSSFLWYFYRLNNLGDHLIGGDAFGACFVAKYDPVTEDVVDHQTDICR